MSVASNELDPSSNKPAAKRPAVEVESVVIRFTGDSGDGMQLTGNQFTSTSAAVGNDLATFPDFPAEIRAPAGTTFGVSGFQLNFAATDIFTPGDSPDVLVAMNPAALKTNLKDLKSGGLLIINKDAFTKANLDRAGMTENPLETGELSGYRTFMIDISTQNERCLKDLSLNHKEVQRTKNFWTLGLLYYLYNRPLEHTLAFIDDKFKSKPEIAEANRTALKAGWMYGDVSEIFQETYRVPAATVEPGTYRNITGNQAAAWGAVAAAERAGIPLFYGSYPITPASDVLHELSIFKQFGVVTFQAEDEIAAMASAIGAAFAGHLAVTGSSGPGVALKSEAIGLAVSTELPVVILNVQRGGPSTGLPTKTEQADLFQAIYGRNGECPVPVVAASTPSDCFDMMLEGARIALKYMTPCFVLTDGYLANGSEPWRIPEEKELLEVQATYCTEPEGFSPFKRNPDTLARAWALPGTPGLEHRVGGLEKDYETGHISYDPMNHERMTMIRQEKIDRIAEDIPLARVDGSESGGKLLMVGWGSTYGAIRQGVRAARREGLDVSHLHLKHLFPFPKNLEEVLRKFEKVVVVEMNMGQLRTVLRSTYLLDVKGFNKIQGKPFKITEIVECIKQELAR